MTQATRGLPDLPEGTDVRVVAPKELVRAVLYDSFTHDLVDDMFEQLGDAPMSPDVQQAARYASDKRREKVAALVPLVGQMVDPVADLSLARMSQFLVSIGVLEVGECGGLHSKEGDVPAEIFGEVLALFDEGFRQLGDTIVLAVLGVLDAYGIIQLPSETIYVKGDSGE